MAPGALDAGDVARLLESAAADVEILGPRGATRGHAVLRQWAEGAGVRLEPVRWFCGADGEVVVAERATWPADGGHRTPPVDVATRFTVRDGLIARIARHDELGSALDAAGLAPADEVGAQG